MLSIVTAECSWGPAWFQNQLRDEDRGSPVAPRMVLADLVESPQTKVRLQPSVSPHQSRKVRIAHRGSRPSDRAGGLGPLTLVKG